jgi:hypothetical protein
MEFMRLKKAEVEKTIAKLKEVERLAKAKRDQDARTLHQPKIASMMRPPAPATPSRT